ncbi:MAG: tetratricopeptide repeat protein [Myxococcales bacterium]|nr:tetratricopeptide repeat protein [Myxococcales bacterium]
MNPALHERRPPCPEPRARGCVPPRTRAGPAALVLALAVAGVLAPGVTPAAAPARAEVQSRPQAPPASEISPAEQAAFEAVLEGKLIRAREVAEGVLRSQPESFVAHFVLGYVQDVAEGNFPLAVYQERQALRLFEAKYGPTPQPDQPWRWHARILRTLASAYGDLEKPEAQLETMARYNDLYRPRMIAERAWPLMKLKRYDEARRAANEGLAEGSVDQTQIAYNALCAIEFEAGRDGESYRACDKAVTFARSRGEQPEAVDLTNFAEAARSVFKLDQSERLLLEAARAPADGYANPYMELGALYTREGRFSEALDALRKVPAYRMQRPAFAREADRSESRRVLAAFYLAVGRSEPALELTDKAMLAPDRRGHNSRDPAQDEALVAVLDRRAHRMEAERVLTDAAARPWYRRVAAWFEASWLRIEGWASGRRAARLLDDPERLVGIFRIGTAKGAVMPPWLVGDLVEIIGPGVVQAAVERAAATDTRPGARALYQAFEAEAALARGEYAEASRLATAALGGLASGEVLLTTRTEAVRAEAARRSGADASALVGLYGAPLQRDPGVFRRLDWAVPVRLSVGAGGLSTDVADALARSPSFDAGRAGLPLTVTPAGAGVRACLLGAGRAVIGCVSEAPEADEAPDEFVARLVADFERQVFAPRIDLSQADIGSLDGNPRPGRDPLKGLLDAPPAP